MHVSIEADIQGQVIDVIRRELQLVGRQIDVRTRLDHLGADSLALVKLTLTLEEAFDIEIPDEEADRIRTVQDAVSAVERHARAPLCEGRPRDEPGNDLASPPQTLGSDPRSG
jgi:acyl carrier protein